MATASSARPVVRAVSSQVVLRDGTGAVVGGVDPAFSADGRYLAFAVDAARTHTGVDDTDKDFSCVHQPSEGAFSRPLRSSAGGIRLAANTGISTCDVVLRDLVVDAQRAKDGLPRLAAELASPSIRRNCQAFVTGSTCEGNGDSDEPALSADGSAVVFASDANDLTDGDTNTATDVYLRRFTPTLTLDPADFGSQLVGQPVTKPVTVRAQGFGPLSLVAAGTALGGAVPGDYAVAAGGTCTNAVLHETETCQLLVTFKPTALGVRAATLTVTPRGPAPATAALTGVGIAPKLVAAPPLAPPGAVSKVTGSGFPAGSTVLLTLDGMPGTLTVTVNGQGAFTVPLVILPHTNPGKRQLHAVVNGSTIQVSIDFLVVPGALQPPTSPAAANPKTRSTPQPVRPGRSTVTPGHVAAG